MGYVRVGVRKKPRRLATEIAVFLLAVTAIGLVVGGGGTHDLPATLARGGHNTRKVTIHAGLPAMSEGKSALPPKERAASARLLRWLRRVPGFAQPRSRWSCRPAVLPAKLGRSTDRELPERLGRWVYRAKTARRVRSDLLVWSPSPPWRVRRLHRSSGGRHERLRSA